jgi:glyoxylase-like metal-dependent hydrolase (beta-lactamase superfamily II)
MYIETFVLGDFQTNCYCVRTDSTKKECILIDPGLHPFTMLQQLQRHHIIPAAVVLTHGHIDHIAGLEQVRKQWHNTQVYIHKDDATMLTDPNENLSALAGTIFQARPAEVILNGNDRIQAAGLEFKVLHTPGHTPGGICLYNASEAIAFVGDTLFAGSVGRTDFPGGDYDQLMESIQTKLMTLPETAKIYTGHGPASTIGNEGRHNPFLS